MRWTRSLAGALILGSASAALAQQPLPRIWDVMPGTPVGELPEEEFVDPACGTNGGPPGLRIASFEDFARCRPEASGLREIWFRYDDELEYIARAARDPDAVARNNAMVVLGQPVILSVLIDRAGIIRGDFPGESDLFQNPGPNLRKELDKLLGAPRKQ